jgi:hypothetical protein
MIYSGSFLDTDLQVQHANLGNASLFSEFQSFVPVPTGSGTQIFRKNPW